MTLFLMVFQAQALTPQPMCVCRPRLALPTCPGTPATTADSSRHSQSGTALCESSQHALLSASFLTTNQLYPASVRLHHGEGLGRDAFFYNTVVPWSSQLREE